MIKLVIFDLDGVLIDTEELHFVSLLEAIAEQTELLPQHIIHTIKNDGTSTRQKLAKLQKEFNLSDQKLFAIDRAKQDRVMKQLAIEVQPDKKVNRILTLLDTLDIRVALVSNSRWRNIYFILAKMGITDRFSMIVHPGDAMIPKPDPCMFNYVMDRHGVKPSETLIVEDSQAGVAAAIRSTARLMCVKDATDLTLEKIKDAIK